jgi:hypothetical protein
MGEAMTIMRAAAFVSRRKPGAGLFAGVLAGMHESRRAQAACEIRRFEHLVREAKAYEARSAAERQAGLQAALVWRQRTETRKGAVPVSWWPWTRAYVLRRSHSVGLLFAQLVNEPRGQSRTEGQRSP